MLYTQATMSPATIEFARSHGGTGLHIGILGALPACTLFMQFVAAVAVNHLRYRRRLWMAVSVLQRLALVPVALAPFLFPGLQSAVWVWALLAATAANHAMLHFCSPLWMSWMGDYLPREGLSQYWGARHVWMQWTAALSLLGGAVLLLGTGWEINTAFAALIGIGALAGVVDILCFWRVEEPAVMPLPQPTLRRVFSAPFKDRQFRTFIGYACYWHFAAMVGAPFISLFMLGYLGMSLAQVLTLWAAAWAGGALFSSRLGRAAEQFGHRPLLILCTALKPLNMIALLAVPFVPADPFWILIPVFMIDALLNAGIAIATNGFLLKNSPQENRTMFIASGTALAGMVGGLTAIVAGAALTAMGSWSVAWRGVQIDSFFVLFGTSLVLRIPALFLALRVHEPSSQGTRHVVMQLVGATPLRMLRFPTGFYRQRNGDGLGKGGEQAAATIRPQPAPTAGHGGSP